MLKEGSYHPRLSDCLPLPDPWVSPVCPTHLLPLLLVPQSTQTPAAPPQTAAPSHPPQPSQAVNSPPHPQTPSVHHPLRPYGAAHQTAQMGTVKIERYSACPFAITCMQLACSTAEHWLSLSEWHAFSVTASHIAGKHDMHYTRTRTVNLWQSLACFAFSMFCVFLWSWQYLHDLLQILLCEYPVAM